jgi:large subunit ribosomal protein L35
MSKSGKFKPHKGLLKRVKVTARGKILRHKGGKRHLMSSKSGSRRRLLGKVAQVSKVETQRFRRLLGLA